MAELAAAGASAALVSATRAPVRPAAAHTRTRRRGAPWLVLAGGLLLGCLVLGAAAAPLLTARDPLAQSARERLQAPTPAHPFGTDEFGRDNFARVLYGGRTSLAATLGALALALAVGVPLGLLAGYSGGRTDGAIMRATDVLYAFPSFLLALVAAGLYGPGLTKMLIASCAVWWVDYARVVRAMVLQVRNEEYVLAARALGASHLRIMTRAVLPQVAGPLAVLASLDLGTLLLALSALSFLGLGAQPPTPEWGVMLAEGRRFFLDHQHVMVFPGAAIFLAALGFNLLGEGLRAALDPHGATYANRAVKT